MGLAHSHDHSHGHGGHAHSHGHGHSHAHAPKDFGPAFAIGVALNTVFVGIEAACGYIYDSMALLADAGHNLSDVLALLLAWAASEAAKRPPQGRFTYGFKSSTILAAIANALLLAIAIGAILLETAHRLLEPSEPQGAVMAIVAGIGVAINTLTALLFMRGQEDLNIKGAYLHMAADALVSLGVVIAGLAILWTGIALIDPLVSLAILAVIGWGTWGLARDSVKLGLNAAPAGIDVDEVRAHLGALDGVAAVHDLHVWPMSTTETALTAHLVMPRGEGSDTFLREAARSLRTRFGIGHSTLQVERDETAACEHPC
ncbi:MAG: cation diffusion facilitator family transporter [Erythrobacter sp.]|nr:cation diffusion facilitator family transporter [Erythrobacter sp.]